MGPFDFSTIQWARKMTALVHNFDAFSADELHKLSSLLEHLAAHRAAEESEPLTDEQLLVILQNLHQKELVKMEALKRGNVLVEFTGGGYEYERFLIRPDGRMPNHKYEAQKA